MQIWKYTRVYPKLLFHIHSYPATKLIINLVPVWYNYYKQRASYLLSWQNDGTKILYCWLLDLFKKCDRSSGTQLYGLVCSYCTTWGVRKPLSVLCRGNVNRWMREVASFMNRYNPHLVSLLCYWEFCFNVVIRLL